MAHLTGSSKDSILELIDQLEEEFIAAANAALASGMEKYMKNHFEFLGIKAPVRKEIQRNWFARLPKDLLSEDRWFIIDILWQKKQREFHYVAIDFLNGWNNRFISASDCQQLKELITTHSWWDSVDAIASTYVGKYSRKFPAEGAKMIAEWRATDNLWLNRSCLIFQLKYKENVDFDLLKDLIKQYQTVNTFFIQKAIGWSLRQYSKCAPEEVRAFIDEIHLKGLACKEASKYL